MTLSRNLYTFHVDILSYGSSTSLYHQVRPAENAILSVFGTDFCARNTSSSRFNYSMQLGLVFAQRSSAPPGSRGSGEDGSTCASLHRRQETLSSTRLDCLARTIAPGPSKTHRCGSLCSPDCQQHHQQSNLYHIIFGLVLRLTPLSLCRRTELKCYVNS